MSSSSQIKQRNALAWLLPMKPKKYNKPNEGKKKRTEHFWELLSAAAWICFRERKNNLLLCPGEGILLFSPKQLFYEDENVNKNIHRRCRHRTELRISKRR